MGCIKFRIAINLWLLQVQEVFDVPGCSRLTALSAANLQIDVLNNNQLHHRMFDFRCPPWCGRDLHSSGMLRSLEWHAVYVLCYLGNEVHSSLQKHHDITAKFRATSLLIGDWRPLHCTSGVRSPISIVGPKVDLDMVGKTNILQE
jgi:hypothetical protein